MTVGQDTDSPRIMALIHKCRAMIDRVVRVAHTEDAMDSRLWVLHFVYWHNIHKTTHLR